MDMMTTGTLARRTGMSVKTIREYADAGLIYTQGRTSAGYRLFAEEALWCTEMIRGLRALGLTVAEIRELGATEEPIGPCLSRLLTTTKERTTARIDELRQVLDRIEAFEAQRRAELAGDQAFDTGDPRAAGNSG
ncbi:MAG: MerR family transcriptional regulator [Nocardioidaceae bacterium]